MPRENKHRSRFGGALAAALGLWPVGGVAGSDPAEARGVVLDRVAAVVEGRIITLSQLRFESRVALIQGGDASAASRALDDAALKNGLEWAVGQRLQEIEADRLKAFAIEPEELNESFRRFEGRIGGGEQLNLFLKAHEVDPAGLARVLERSLRAERMLDSKVRLRAQVTEAEVRGAYASGAHGLTGSYEQVRASLRDRLFRERYSELARAELRKMKERADIRWVAPFVLPALEGGGAP